MFFDKRTLYVIMAIMVLWGLSSYLTNTSALLGETSKCKSKKL